jgi:NADH:ubiquinone oxidoreductase subunit
MRIVMLLFTLIFGKKIGVDKYGNTYYSSVFFKKEKRWVLYKGMVEASKTPINWDMWLRFMIDNPEEIKKNFFWEKDHLPNLTGTNFAFKPQAYNSKIHYSSNYQAWKKEN